MQSLQDSLSPFHDRRPQWVPAWRSTASTQRNVRLPRSRCPAFSPHCGTPASRCGSAHPGPCRRWDSRRRRLPKRSKMPLTGSPHTSEPGAVNLSAGKVTCPTATQINPSHGYDITFGLRCGGRQALPVGLWPGFGAGLPSKCPIVVFCLGAYLDVRVGRRSCQQLL